MYKKIKNGSFMNLIWFIICILPIMFLLIYSMQFFTKQSDGYRVNNLINAQNNIMVVGDDGETTVTNDYFTVGVADGVINEQTNYFQFHYTLDNYSTQPIYFIIDNEQFDGIQYFLYVEFVEIQNADNIQLEYDIQYNGDIIDNVLYKDNLYNLMGTFTYDDTNFNIRLKNDTIPNEPFTFDFAIKLFVTFDKPNDSISDIDNWFSFTLNDSYLLFVENFYYTISSNGFISNAFLNLSQFFGVTNIYVSLACYYIEYLLVIALLHLAFDILYMLPNICHKFMEKIGGERD